MGEGPGKNNIQNVCWGRLGNGYKNPALDSNPASFWKFYFLPDQCTALYHCSQTLWAGKCLGLLVWVWSRGLRARQPGVLICILLCDHD